MLLAAFVPAEVGKAGIVQLVFYTMGVKFYPEEATISFDGKTICSTRKMGKYDSPLHIISAQLADLGITTGQRTVDGKSNEIPAVRKLLQMLDVKGCTAAADALHFQKETAKTIVKDSKADYLLSVKDNHESMKEDIEGYVQDEKLQAAMDGL